MHAAGYIKENKRHNNDDLLNLDPNDEMQFLGNETNDVFFFTNKYIVVCF